MKKSPRSGEVPAALMRDVAELAGVATSTVSRALTNPGRVSAKTRDKVAEAARKLGYTPNAAARNLRVGRSRVVMIVLPGPLHYGASQVIPLVLQGIDSTLSREGYNLLIANLDREEATEEHILDLASGGTVIGAIVLSSGLPRAGKRSLRDTGIPIVSLLHDHSHHSVPSVVTNDRGVMRDLMKRLMAHGHRRAFYISGPKDSYHEPERTGGILDALRAGGGQQGDLIVSEGLHNYEDGFAMGEAAAERYLGLSDRPTAVMSCSDDAAISFMARIRAAGLKVPGDLSIFGFDGSEVGAFLEPPLSTIVQPARDMGARAAELLLTQLGRQPVPIRTVMDSSILERGSS